MATIYDATVFKGAGVFSKNIKYQMPHLVWQFPDIKDIYPASINVELNKPLLITNYDCTTLPIPWLEVAHSGRILGWRFERFSFLEIQLEFPIGGQLYRAWIMDCHNSFTFHNDPKRFEIISKQDTRHCVRPALPAACTLIGPQDFAFTTYAIAPAASPRWPRSGAPRP